MCTAIDVHCNHSPVAVLQVATNPVVRIPHGPVALFGRPGVRSAVGRRLLVVVVKFRAAAEEDSRHKSSQSPLSGGRRERGLARGSTHHFSGLPTRLCAHLGMCQVPFLKSEEPPGANLRKKPEYAGSRIFSRTVLYHGYIRNNGLRQSCGRGPVNWRVGQHQGFDEVAVHEDLRLFVNGPDQIGLGDEPLLAVHRLLPRPYPFCVGPTAGFAHCERLLAVGPQAYCYGRLLMLGRCRVPLSGFH